MIINVIWLFMNAIAINMQRKTIILSLCLIYISLTGLLICYPPVHSISHSGTEIVSVETSGFLRSPSPEYGHSPFTDELNELRIVVL